jgi:4-hydroxy 2-oxovalerate aldolase
MTNDIRLLDCTFRDGGYYNNWNFDEKVIQKYLFDLKKLNINFVELGFRTLEKLKIKGKTGYTTDKFIKSFKIPGGLNIGVMINASDLLENKDILKNCKKLFPTKNPKINFVRLACHLHEVYLLKDVFVWLKKNGYVVCVNLMQISEIKKKEIKKVCIFLNKTNIDVLYLADSLGSLKPNLIKKIVKEFKILWKKDLGFHPHNNLKLALKNSIEANKYGVKWIDCTVSGMGRGPGNLITEDIINYLYSIKKKDILSSLVKKYFFELKKKHKWGPNIYYEIAAKYKIHPTYIQKILSDKRYKKLNYLTIINSLRKTETSKYNPTKYFKFAFFSNNSKKIKNNSIHLDNSKNVLILGPGESVRFYKKKIENFVKKKNLYVIALNSTSSINEKFVSLRAACHPLRIISDIPIYKKLSTKLILPYSSLNKTLKSLINKDKINFYNYGLNLNLDKKISFNKNTCSLPSPLVLGYVLSLLSNNIDKQLYFAGIDGFNLDNPNTDNSVEILKFFLKNIFKKKPISLTPNKYKGLFRQYKV